MGDFSPVPTTLVGRERKHSLVVGGVVLALFGGSFVTGLFLVPSRWIPQGFAQAALIFFGFPIAIGVIAAANAAWNDGFLLSWLLVFAPVFGWLLSNVAKQAGPVYLNETYFSLGLAILTASIVGTVTYTIGVRRRGVPKGTDGRPAALVLLVGDDGTRPAVWAISAGGLFLGAALVTSLTDPRQFPITLADVVVGMVGPSLLEKSLGLEVTSLVFDVIVVGGALGLAMWPAVRHAGLLVSWGMLFGPMYGVTVTEFVLGEISGSGPLFDATYAFVLALVGAAILGTIGFVLGRGLRWVGSQLWGTRGRSTDF